MNLHKKLEKHHLILASGSPRRQQFLKDLGLDFEICLKSVEETYPDHLKGARVAEYLAELKTSPFVKDLRQEDILITGDTIVCLGDTILGKPKNDSEAFEMLKDLSGRPHQVISSVCLKSTQKTILFHGETKVFFKEMDASEIWHYIKTCKPFDKAGAYGIQEWIGKIGVEKIEGSFYNVMGMPVSKVYTALMDF